MPYGANFGVEGTKTQQNDGAVPLNTKEEGIRSDRELARLITEMFQVRIFFVLDAFFLVSRMFVCA